MRLDNMLRTGPRRWSLEIHRGLGLLGSCGRERRLKPRVEGQLGDMSRPKRAERGCAANNDGNGALDDPAAEAGVSSVDE